LRTVVLDAGPDERAAEVSAGMIAPVGEASWGEDARLDASLASAAAWPGFATELAAAAGSPVPYRRAGSLHVALDRDETAELRRLHELHERLGLEASWLRGSECRRLEAGLTTSVAGGLEIPGEAEVDPRALLAALRSAVRAAGGEIREEAAAAVEVEDGGMRGVRLERGEALAAERVLIAAGARSGGLLPEGAGELPPVHPVKGEILRLRAGIGEMPCEHIVVTERVYVVPREDGEVVVGATSEDRGFDLRVTAGGVHELLREAYRALPEIAELELVECAAGLRPATPDNAPVIGTTAIEGLLVATGHHRNGILLAPFTADGIVALLTGGEAPPALAALEPCRRERIGA
jgi:glycine oxidase